MKKHIVALLIFVCCLNLLLVHKLNDNTHRYDNNVLALKDTIEYYQSKNNELVATKLAFEAELSDIKNLNKSLYDEIKSLKTKSKVKSGITYSGVIENTPHDTVYSIVPDTVSRCFLREFSFKNPYRELSGNILYANDSLKLKFSKDIVNFDYTIAIDKKNQIIVIQGTEEHPYIATPVSCTCQDFAKRRLPCKHIYRLAIELGELGTAVRYAERHKAFSPITDMQKYRELYNAGTISRETFDKMCEALESAREDEKADSFLRHFE